MNQSFTLDMGVYSSESIISAINDYSDVTIMSFSFNSLNITGESEDEIQEIFLEFMNYVLSL